jgi:hypothetical protein
MPFVCLRAAPCSFVLSLCGVVDRQSLVVYSDLHMTSLPGLCGKPAAARSDEAFMALADGTEKPKQTIRPMVRRPVAPASTRAYVPFVPPAHHVRQTEAVDGRNWPRLWGRVGIAAAGMGMVCIAVVAATGAQGPAAALVLPMIFTAVAAGVAGIIAAGRQGFFGWKPGGVAVGLAAAAFGCFRYQAKIQPPASTSVVVVDHSAGSVASDAPVEPAIEPTPTPAPAPVPVAPAASASVIADQTITARADAMMAAETGFTSADGWVAAGRLGSAAVALSAVDPAGPQLAALRAAVPIKLSMVVLAIDNTDGNSAVRIDPEFIRAVTANGVTVGALSPRLVLSTAIRDRDTYLRKFGRPLVVPAGTKLNEAVVFFPESVDVAHLHGIVFTANGVTMTFRGHVMAVAEKAGIVKAAGAGER